MEQAHSLRGEEYHWFNRLVATTASKIQGGGKNLSSPAGHGLRKGLKQAPSPG